VRRAGIVAVASDVRARDDRSPPEMVFPVVRDVVARSGFSRAEIDLTCAASSDMLEGRPFSFGFALDVTGAVPPVEESHTEGDGAWAAYEAWVRIQARAANVALVIAWGKSSEGALGAVMNTTLDPFYEAPLGIDHDGLAALQAAAAGVSSLTRAAPCDGVVAMVIAVEDALRAPPMAWIDGVAHSTDGGHVGARDLARAPSARRAFDAAMAMAGWSDPDHVELHAAYEHQIGILRAELGVEGGARLERDPIMATGLLTLATAASALDSGDGSGALGASHDARRALAHATAGHCLQANMVWLLSR
jgi:hypothetical protein